MVVLYFFCVLREPETGSVNTGGVGTGYRSAGCRVGSRSQFAVS